MRYILVTGETGYIGKNTCDWICCKNSQIIVDKIELRGNDWKNKDFSKYSTIVHTVGIAHKKITNQNKDEYFKVNSELTLELAVKAKNEGVKHFIFLSSMSVYADKELYINLNTPTNPDNVYGESKLLAEKKLLNLKDETFKISIVRPPMVYGKGCKGNYNSLRKIAIMSPIFPFVDNKRSMIYIDNLTEFLYQLIITEKEGVFFPQNKELVNTSDWVYKIGAANNKKIYLSKILGFFVKLSFNIPILSRIVKKAFDDCYYDPKISIYDFEYQIVSFVDSVTRTELGDN